MICVLKHILVVTIEDGVRYQQRCAPDGIEVGDTEKLGDAMVDIFDDVITLPDERKYFCEICGEWFHGEKGDSFDAVRKHLGKLNIKSD